MKRLAFLLLLALIPTVAADTADIPALTGTGTGTATAHFIAAHYVSDGATIPAGGTQFAPLFGDSATRSTESDTVTQAAFHYNITNFRVSNNAAACGGLGAGETFTIILRKNGAATALTGTCAAANPVNSFTLDTDTVAVVPGDRLTISVSVDSVLVARAIRIGITAEGFKAIPITTNITTNPVPDMTNEILEALNVYAPLLIFVAVIIWAEASKDLFVYILAILAGAALIAVLWDEIIYLRFLVALATGLLVFRAYLSFDELKNAGDD